MQDCYYITYVKKFPGFWVEEQEHVAASIKYLLGRKG